MEPLEYKTLLLLPSPKVEEKPQKKSLELKITTKPFVLPKEIHFNSNGHKPKKKGRNLYKLQLNRIRRQFR